MSELKELKVGDVVSYASNFAGHTHKWTSLKIYDSAELTEFKDTVLNLSLDWILGVHSSLVPEGYAIVPIKPTSEMIKPALSWFTAWTYMRAGDKKNAIESAYKTMIESAPK